ITVGHPSTILPPCAVVSPILAEGSPPMVTVAEPLVITSGGPTHTAISPTRAAGSLPIKTVGKPTLIGPPTCGIGTNAGVTIGHTCMSVILAAGGIFFFLIDHNHGSLHYNLA